MLKGGQYVEKGGECDEGRGGGVKGGVSVLVGVQMS